MIDPITAAGIHLDSWAWSVYHGSIAGVLVPPVAHPRPFSMRSRSTHGNHVGQTAVKLPPLGDEILGGVHGAHVGPLTGRRNQYTALDLFQVP
jgi:hypothetical protein